jgi:hypothetical protein
MKAIPLEKSLYKSKTILYLKKCHQIPIKVNGIDATATRIKI